MTHSRFKIFSPFKKLGLLAFVLLLYWPDYGLAQITKTARVELDDNHETFPIGAQTYLTRDMERRLTEQVIATRHGNNLRGGREDSALINLGLASTPSWLVFSVMNSSSAENWVLDFGGLPQGRLSLAGKFLLFKQTEEGVAQIAAHDLGSEIEPAHAVYDRAIPLTIKKGTTELYIAYIETAKSSPGLIRPNLISETAFVNRLSGGSLLSLVLSVFLIAAAGFFVSIAYIQRNPGYAWFSLYYLSLLLFATCIDKKFFSAFSSESALIFSFYPLAAIFGLLATRFFLQVNEKTHTENTLFLSSGFFIGAAMILSVVFPFRQSVMDELLLFIPAQLGMMIAAGVAFLQAQSGRYAGHYMALGWITSFAGSIISGMAIAGGLNASPLMISMFWIFLIPQTIFFTAGTAKKIQMLHQDERQNILRESRAAHSLAKLKQSKDSADQARLMRVIERERELMVELREREIQRTEEMRLAKEAADEANKAKSTFLAVVSHEIRTPMTGIMGVLKLLQDTKLNQEQRDYLLTIQKSGDTMIALLNDILDFEKIEKGSVTLETIDFDLPKLIQGVVTLMSGHAIEKNVNLGYDIPADFPQYVKGDPVRLRQVLLNLVSNAIKFTENGDVTIRLRSMKLEDKSLQVKGDYEIYFAVEDTGIGISQEAQEKLFSPFAQANVSIARKYGGTGLGLAISQRLIAAMGSSIRLTSQENKGSTFFFTLLMEQGNEEIAEEQNQYKQPVQNQTSRMKVLVIEDNAINRKILQKFLEKEGHTVTAVDSGEMALDLLRQESFDAIFTDINLSGISGLETAKTIRQSPVQSLAEVPIIAVTGNVSPKDVEHMEQAGINGFIRKPIPYDELMEILANIRKGTLAKPKEEAATGLKTQTPTSEKLPAEEQDSVVNLPLLDGLLKSLGKEQTFTLLESCIEKMDDIIGTFQDPDKISEIQFARDRAHELRGMAANFGMSLLSDLAARIEAAANQNNIETALFEARDLKNAGQKTKKSIENWMKKFK